MKQKGFLIAGAVVASVCVVLFCVVFLLHKRGSAHVSEPETTTGHIEFTEPGTELETFVGYSEAEEFERRPALLEEVGDETHAEVSAAEFDYSGFEYWQQNALNTIAKIISSCPDEDNVRIIDVVIGDDVGHIVVERDGVIYESDFNAKSFAIIETY